MTDAGYEAKIAANNARGLKKPDLGRNAPRCRDSRECRRRISGKCMILTGTYETDGACPFCKE